MKTTLSLVRLLAWCCAAVFCMPAPTRAELVILDPQGNLSGDPARAFMDILETSIRTVGSNFVFEVQMAAPFPSVAQMAGGKRFDVIWFIDIDRNRATGQSPEGNDYNIHLYLDETGWHYLWFKVSPVSQADGIGISDSGFQIAISGDRATLTIPEAYLPGRSFDMWATCFSGNARDWPPVTWNPPTGRATDDRPSYYAADFEGVVGPEWSSQQTDLTPAGNRRFLGQFGNDTVSLSLRNLPAHQAVTIGFDLFVIQSWDSDGNGGGPDVWDLRVTSGPALLHTTFSNTGGPEGFRNNHQAFPGNFPDEVHPARSGALENNSLGYGIYGDAVYHLTFTFPHTADAVTLNFSGQGLQSLGDESWGLDNVRVDLLPAGDTSPVLILQPHELSAVLGNSAALSAPACGAAPL
ncbi:MAG: hypothetical protein AB9869_20710 [Verrucomicrobiia bacterium]